MAAPAADSQLREIGGSAVWTVTSSKPGCGVEMLRDGKTETYWQSDGVNPHFITVQFPRRVQMLELRIYMDIKQDESYTPNKISVRAGTGLHDLQVSGGGARCGTAVHAGAVAGAQERGWVGGWRSGRL